MLRLSFLFFLPNMISNESADLTGLRHAFKYPRSHADATPDLPSTLQKEISSLITENGPLPFQDYMAQCLYHPELGYYARPDAQTVSKDGDFMTSVSVGPVFGQLLAQRLHRFWIQNGSPSNFTILELGAHDGSLALDILNTLPEINPTFAKSTSYLISEPLPARRKILQDRLADRATIISDPTEHQSEFGVVIANEVLDALPVPLYFLTKNHWHETLVTLENDHLEWDSRPIDLSLPMNLPEGYVTEGPPNLTNLLAPLTEVFQKGLQIWIDYGLDEETLLHPARTAGTLRCYRNHSTLSHPLDHPGLQDITADVNFTAVEKTATDLGLTVHPTMNQSRYLTHCAKDWLLGDLTPKQISQFQTLIHPSQFGNRFYALELTKGAVDRAFP